MNLKPMLKLLAMLSLLFVFAEASRANLVPRPRDYLRSFHLSLGSSGQKSETGFSHPPLAHNNRTFKQPSHPQGSGFAAGLPKEPRPAATLSSFILGQYSSLPEPSWLLFLGTCLLGSAAALFHKMRHSL
jgi:hypothetical protein